MPPPAVRFASVRDTAAIYGVAERTVYRWIAAGAVKARRRSPAPQSDWLIQLPDDAPDTEAKS